MKKLFTLFFAVMASAGTMSAGIIYDELIDGLFYKLDTANQEASVEKPPYKQGLVYDTLKHVVIPETVEYNGITCTVVEIGNNAFGARSSDNDGCDSLITISIPKTVSKIAISSLDACRGYHIDELDEEESLRFRSSLQSITVDPENPYFSSLDGVLYNKEQTKLIQYPCARQGAFTVPNTVTDIEESAFQACIGLTSIVLPNSITQLKGGAFAFCTTLTSINIPSTVTSIGMSALATCTSLTSITIPSGVTTIGHRAFFVCLGLDTIICEASTPPTLGFEVFTRVDATACSLYVPAGSVELYSTATKWDIFTNILPIQAQEVEVAEAQAEPEANSVTIEWPKHENAETYIVVIKKGDEIICTLEFDANGQLLSIAYAAPGRNGHHHPTRTAMQTATGWQYAISGLESGTAYTYIITAKKGETIVYETSVPFQTQDATAGIDLVDQVSESTMQKILRNGQIYILRGDKVYTITGQEVQ